VLDQTAFLSGSGNLLSGSMFRKCWCTICLLNGLEAQEVIRAPQAEIKTMRTWLAERQAAKKETR